jgi:hypothetical protein
MKTLALAILISGAGLVRPGVAQDSATIFSDAAKKLADEWMDNKNGGFAACLKALDKLSKPGSLNPEQDAADALALLSNALTTAKTIYDAAAKADLPTFKNELAKATTVTVAKSDAANYNLILALAGKSIEIALAQHPTELNEEVAQKYQTNPLWALSQLMELTRSVSCSVRRSDGFLTTAKAALGASELADSDATARAAAAQKALTTAQSELTKVQTELTAASTDLSTASTDLVPLKGPVNVKDAQSKVKTADDSVTDALAKIKNINEAQKTFDAANKTKTAADQSLATAKELFKLTQTNDHVNSDANLMEIYRICFGLDPDKLFGLVARYFQKPTE